MFDFTFDHPTKVLFGPGSRKKLHLEKMPGTKPLLVTSSGSSVRRFGYLDDLENEMKLAGLNDYVIYSGVSPNPSTGNVMDGVKLAKDNACDFVVALGGGSVLDCSKCIAMLMNNDGTVWDYATSESGGKKPIENPAAPLICLATSSGTGSEVTRAAVISNEETQEKTGLFDQSFLPVISIVDSELMMSVPPVLTAYQGMDAFFHASETVLNTLAHPMAEMFALKAVEYVAKYLPRAVQNGDDQEAREFMALASSLAGFYMMTTSGHRIEHALGSFHKDLAHGAGLIMTAHAYYGFMAEKQAAEEKMIKMARAMGAVHPKSGKDFVDKLDELIESIGCKDLKMSDAGITKEELPLVVKKIRQVLGGNIKADPVLLSDEDYMKILTDAWR